MRIGDRIKQRRIELGMSQIELAEKVRISKQTLYKYENNIVTNIPSKNIEILAHMLETTPAYLMGWEPEPDPMADYDKFMSNRYFGQILGALSDIGYSDEYNLLNDFSYLNKENREKTIKYVNMLRQTQSAEEEILKAAHERTDIEVTDEMRKHDDDIMNDDSEWE